MNDSIFGLVGSGGCAREVMPLMQHCIQDKFNSTIGPMTYICAYVDIESKQEVNGLRVISEPEFFDCKGKKFYNIAINDGIARRAISEIYQKNSIEPISLIASSSIVGHGCDIGEGAIICDNCIVGANVKIGRFVHLNVYSYVAHDCVIGDFVTLAPRVTCNGSVIIEDGAYIGAGAIIRQGRPQKPLKIGAGATIGMGAVVLDDVAPRAVVIGNPARPMIRKKSLS